KAHDAAVTIHVNHPEAERLFGFDQDSCQSHIGARIAMLLQHPAVIHLVNVIAGKNENVLRLLGTDGVDVLINGIGGAHVPVVAYTLHRRQDLYELAHLARHYVPALTDMAVQRECFVLGKNEHTPQIGVDAIGEGDVDDSINSAESDGRLGAIAGQRIESFAGATGQQHSERVFHHRPGPFLAAAGGPGSSLGSTTGLACLRQTVILAQGKQGRLSGSGLPLARISTRPDHITSSHHILPSCNFDPLRRSSKVLTEDSPGGEASAVTNEECGSSRKSLFASSSFLSIAP